MTDTKSDKNREAKGQGIANIVSGLFGGMAGCAMIGQSVINVKSGGRGRLSTFIAGAFLLVLLVLLGKIVREVPMAALVGVMIMVSIGTFSWNSLRTIHKVPLAEAIIMVTVVVIVVLTDNLSIGVGVGVVMSALRFGWKMSQLHITEANDSSAAHRVYQVRGQMFFGTMSQFIDHFKPQDDSDEVTIDFARSHIWDHSAVIGD